jgi:VWFA-related protein
MLTKRALCALIVAAAVPALRVHPTDAQSKTSGTPVSVGFVAVGRDGKPIADLKPEEVQLRVDGRQRTIKSLQQINSILPSTPDTARPVGPPPPSPFGTNLTTAAGSRTTFLLIEDASFRPGNERLTKQAVEQFLSAVPAGDRVALITLPQPTTRTDPTTPEDVRKALARVAGIAPQNPSDDQVACRTRETLETLRNILDSLAANDQPSTVMVFSSGMTATTRTIGVLGTSSCDLSTEHFQNVGAAASAARALVYVIQSDLTVTQRSAGLENLAGVTGAQVLLLAAAGDNALNRIALETSAPYVVAFEPDAPERNGQNHRLEIRLTRPDVTVRAGTQIQIAREGARTSRASRSPRDMLREPTVYRDLPVRVAGFPSRESGDKLRITTVAEPADAGTKLTAAAVAIYDASGRLTAQVTAKPEELASGVWVSALPAAPGKYRLRFAAVDADGRSGTADYAVAAELATAGALRVSSLVLGIAGASPRPMLQFGNEAEAIAFFEVYGKPPAQLPLRLEVAATADGPTLNQVKVSAAAGGEPDRYRLSGAIPLTPLAPGDYVVRVIIGGPGEETRVMRTLRKTR